MSASQPIRLTVAEARRFHRRAVGLDAPVPEPETALRRRGFVQIDPINVCGRMHDLILRNRVEGYREGGLMRLLHGPEDAPTAVNDRVAFEQHLPHSNILVAMPVESWPWLSAAMRRRAEGASVWSGGLEPREEAIAAVILREIAERGPLSSAELADGQKVEHGWGAQTSLAKATLQKLFFHGRLLISRRKGNRRFYDLPERVLPQRILSLPEPSPEETARWVTLLKVRQRGLALLSPADRARAGDTVAAVAVEGGAVCWCLRSDLPLLDSSDPPDAEREEPMLLAPLDPLVYDRKMAAALWNFSYTWEVYTPPEKRVRGYYALPVLHGLELAGHVDPKADRAAGKLTVVNRSVRRGTSTARAVRQLAGFLGLK